MADISSIKLPDNNTYNFKDSEGRALLDADPNKILIVSTDSTGTYDYTMTINTSGNALINLSQEEY